MENLVNSVIIADIGNKIIGRVRGRRNYVIRLELIDGVAYVGAMGIMNNRGYMRASLQYMSKHGTTWAEYIYKKDWMAAIKLLEDNNFNVRMIN